MEELSAYINKNVLTDDYSIGEPIGSGGYSTVRTGVNRATKEKVALKMIMKEKAFDGMNLLDEIKLARELGSHQNIIQTYDIYSYKKYFVVVLELIKGGELLGVLMKHFEGGNTYSELEIAIVMRQIIQGVHHCHEHKILHRDLKPDNVLIENQQNMGEIDALKKNPIKLCDFGMSCQLDADGFLEDTCGTSEYMSPERLRAQRYNEKSDVWALGVILYILVAGTFPFWGDSPREILSRAESNSYPKKTRKIKVLSHDLQLLIYQMLAKNPDDRPTTKDLLEHDWCTGKTADTAELEGALADLKIFNRKRKLRVAYKKILAQNRLKVILGAIRSEKLLLDLVDSELLSMDDLKKVFEILSGKADDNFMIDKEQFMLSFQEIATRNEKTVDQLFDVFQQENQVNVRDFCLALSTKTGADPEKVLDFAFDIFDSHNTNAISNEEFHAMMKGICSTTGEEMPEHLIENQFEIADVDDSGDISKEEFLTIAKENQVIGRYFRNMNRLLRSRKELFIEQVSSIRSKSEGRVFLKKRIKLFGLLGTYVERYCFFDKANKLLKLYGTHSSFLQDEKPMEVVSLNQGQISKIPKKSVLNRERSKSQWLFESENSGPIVWEYVSETESEVWAETFHEEGLKIELKMTCLRL